MVDLLAFGLIFGGVAIAGAGYYGFKPKRLKMASLVIGIVMLVAGVALAAGLLSISYGGTGGAPPAGEGMYSVLFTAASNQHIGGAAAEAAVVDPGLHKVTFFDTAADFAEATNLVSQATVLNNNVGSTTDVWGFNAKVSTVPSVNVPPVTPMGAYKADGVTWDIAYVQSGTTGTFSGQQVADQYNARVATAGGCTLTSTFVLDSGAAGAVTAGNTYAFTYLWGGVSLEIDITITA